MPNLTRSKIVDSVAHENAQLKAAGKMHWPHKNEFKVRGTGKWRATMRGKKR